MKSSSQLRVFFWATGAVLLAETCSSAGAATLCVKPGGTGGCYATIAAAVAAANPGDTIQVGPGKYFEDVVIGQPLSLIGADRSNTIIDATGKANGVYIDGRDNPGLRQVVVAGFTIQNAKFEGILVTNASSVTISDNRVVSNDRALNPSPPPTCPGQPSFETNEDFDCGEGIHLSGVDHSIVANNLMENNSGGILLSDDTGATHDNLITSNIARNNPFDCGITLASHQLETGSTAPRGVFHNTIAANQSFRNGLAVEGAGAGVGLFVAGQGLETSGNVVIGNRLTGNGLPGVAFHLHTASTGQNVNNNVIVGNYIAGNGADTEDAATPGPTGINVFGVAPITGTVIAGNVIKDEQVDIAVSTVSPAVVDVHLNDLLGQQIGLDNLGSGGVDATENWWGCAKGPGFPGCTSVSGSNIVSTPFLTRPSERGDEQQRSSD
jgi:nitrous oxidase accessory protein NosD